MIIKKSLSLVFCVFTVVGAFAQDDDAGSTLQRYSGLDLIREGPTIDAQLAQRLLRRGNTYANLERYDEAIEEYHQAISADPNSVEAIRNLANVYYYLERYDEAKPLLARFIQLQDSPSASLLAALTALGDLERQQGNFENSIDYDLQAITLGPGNDSQVHLIANTYNNAGAAGKAIQIYRAAIEVMPDNAFFDRSLGRLFEQEGQLEQALTAYQSAADKDPESAFYADLVERTRTRLQR